MFKDKVYEEMDDISKMIEPYQYSLNEDLSKFPDEVQITAEYLDSPYGLSVRDVVRSEAQKLGLIELINRSYEVSNEFFEFKIVDELGDNVDETSFDIKTGYIRDKVFMFKKKIAYEDSDIEKIVKSSLLASLDSNYSRHSDLNISRINEVADLFNATNVKQNRSVRKKMYSLKLGFSRLVDSKKLDIRDVGLAQRLGKWIILYIKDGNLAALNNVTRLKIMTHQNKPIYSMEEKAVQ
jgi:hypothetical protein